MIHNKSRAGWIGASDTARVMGRWDTVTFARWWLVKMGITANTYRSRELLAGTMYEHRILDAIGVLRRDRQIKRRRLRLRVNLDGETVQMVHEVKTYKREPFKVSAAYWMQCQVEMYASGKACEIVAYHLLEEDYYNFFRPIDPARLSRHPIPYDAEWINNEYLPRLRYLAWCLKRRRTPNELEFTRLCHGL